MFKQFSSNQDEFKLSDLESNRNRSKSFVNDSYHFKPKATEVPKIRESMNKFSLIKTLFKTNKDRKRKLVKKIDKFADEKASHFVNMRKIKKRDPFSDNFEAAQVRSLSRTFTSGRDKVKNLNMHNQFGPSLSSTMVDRIEMSPKAEEVKTQTKSWDTNEENKSGENHISPSCIGDFYDNTDVFNRNTIYVKSPGVDISKSKSRKSRRDQPKGPITQINTGSSNSKGKDSNELIKTSSDGMVDDIKSLSVVVENESGKETAEQQEKRIRKQSIFGHLKTWKLLRIIVKSGDDLRQEQFAMQLISQIDQIFRKKKLNIWLKPYEILATGKGCGLIEFLADAISIDAFKKKNPGSLDEYFRQNFKSKKKLREARLAFASSLAGYSLVCFILQIKDRHNGNILIDSEGHVIHIDFGFLLTNAPGKGLNFEKAPFKLTDEFVDVMNGVESKYFKKFRQKLISGFSAIHNKAEHLICLVEMMITSQNDLDCFKGGRERVIFELRHRLFPYHNKKMSKNE